MHIMSTSEEGVPLVVFDLDGVLADVRHRVHFVAERPKDWDSFFDSAVHDPVLPEGVDLLRARVSAGCEVAYLTGRPERCRDDTVAWLREHDLPAGDLHMRPDHDRRPARLFKRDVLRALAKTRVIPAVVDDDAEVVALLRSDGFSVVHATWMDGGTAGVDGAVGGRGDRAVREARALREAQETDGRT